MVNRFQFIPIGGDSAKCESITYFLQLQNSIFEELRKTVSLRPCLMAPAHVARSYFGEPQLRFLN